jgi:circadian clock protein KaiB
MSAVSIFKFRLYVAGDAPNSTQAVSNIHAFCNELLKDQYDIEVVDVMREPQRALADGVFLTPMVVRTAPAPIVRIVGNLSEKEPLYQLIKQRGDRQ